MFSVVNDEGTTETGSLMDDIVREGARRMLAAALEAEVDQYIAELAGERGGAGRRLVVRNGRHRERTVTTAAGPVAVKAPRVNDKRVDVGTGERKRFSSQILAPWCRKSPKVSEVLPLLYVHGLSSGDFVPAMEQFLGSSDGLSPATVTRLTKQWAEDHTAFQALGLSDSDYVYVWADGVHPKVRLGQAHSCVLVLMGVRPDGRKELIALAEGLRESTESWADLLRGCRRRGMRGPELVVGDGAMDLWRALAEVFPQARHQRCWVHKVRNVMNALPKAARKVADETDELLAFYDFPAEHWVHLLTTNPIESTFSTVKLRTKVTRGAGSPVAALAMVFKLVESAQARWRAITAPHLVALVRNGARFENGHLVERSEAGAA
ncbi:IS256 family transposase [Streptomyces sp. BE147]|uniref:IS256 family transposase n=1 Tax=Streptomyces sp. BE147 TaxID=3002524 RepID=UPI002E75EE98|nr:IS256 family transposase [Streptomyces sp. BE147]MEE1737866.1 IS256 family transposase [Streptomyces sp. BE147]